MTIAPVHFEQARTRRPLTGDERRELQLLTARLPQLRTGWSAPLVLDAALRLDAALWALACRYGLDVRPGARAFDVVDALARSGWSTGAARDALRAFVMLRSDDGAADDEAASRLLSYLELRCRFG
jgi:hypothetical protein